MALSIVSIQEFLIKSGLWWRAYGMSFGNKNTLSERISTNCARCQRRKAIRKSSIFRVRPRRANELRLRMHTFRFNEKPVCTVLYGLELFSNFTRILITIVTLLSFVKYIYFEKTTKNWENLSADVFLLSKPQINWQISSYLCSLLFFIMSCIRLYVL